MAKKAHNKSVVIRAAESRKAGEGHGENVLGGRRGSR